MCIRLVEFAEDDSMKNKISLKDAILDKIRSLKIYGGYHFVVAIKYGGFHFLDIELQTFRLKKNIFIFLIAKYVHKYRSSVPRAYSDALKRFIRCV